MAREIAPGIHWVQECGPDRGGAGDLEVHVPQHAYLLTGEETLLFDTLSPASTEHVLDELDVVLDDGLDYLVPSHPDVPHAGNVRAIQEAYPEAELVGPRYGTGQELYHLDEATKVGQGDAIDLGELEVAFHEAAFPDSAVHVWMTETTSRTLFTVDWLGFPHLGDECDLCVEEFDREVSVDRLVNLHEFVLFWLKYVDIDRTLATVDRLLTEYDPDLIAPAHGNPVRADVGDLVEKMKTATERIRREEDERIAEADD